MDSKERRKYIEEVLHGSESPIKGSRLAKKTGVTRQVIVKDIALLRAEGHKIIATPEGYLVSNDEKNIVKRVLALSHKSENIKDELETIVKFGGIIEDVIIEHAVYGELRGMLMIKNLYDVQNFVNKLKKYNAEPLLILTAGIHLHTISAENEEAINYIVKELKDKGYLISE